MAFGRALDGVVRVEPVSDWRLVRDIRLRALQSDARAFDGDLGEEAARHDAYWRSATTVTTWVAAFIGELAVGIARAVGEHGRRHVESVWVDPHFRRRGVASRMMRELARLERERGERQLRIWVLDGNDGGRAFYDALGFVPTGERKPLPSNPARTEERMHLRLG